MFPPLGFFGIMMMEFVQIRRMKRNGLSTENRTDITKNTIPALIENDAAGAAQFVLTLYREGNGDNCMINLKSNIKGRLLLIITGLCIIALAGCAQLKPPSDKYYGISTGGKSIVFVLDISGSMEGKDEGSLADQVTAAATQEAGNAISRAVGGTIGSFLGGAVKSESTKLAKAKRELIPAVKGLTPDTKFSIVTFGDKIESWEGRLTQATDGSITSAVLYLERIESNGGTPAQEALEKGFRFSGVQTIFFLSDGRPNKSTEGILKKVSSLNRNKRVTIHTIGLGDDQDRDFLCRLARDNGGVYIRNDQIECGTLKP